MSKLIDQLKRHEGKRLFPYHCSANKLTIAYGRNLEDVGVTEEEAELMLSNDVKMVQEQLSGTDWYNGLDEVRQAVCDNMCFNLGFAGLNTFQKFIGCLSNADYEGASKEMITGSNGGESKWASQVGQRAYELAEQMRTGQWQDV